MAAYLTLKGPDGMKFGADGHLYVAVFGQGDITVLDPAPSVAAGRRERDRKPAEDMVVIIEDVVQLLDTVSNGLRKGHYPDKKLGSNVARALHGLADNLES